MKIAYHNIVLLFVKRQSTMILPSMALIFATIAFVTMASADSKEVGYGRDDAPVIVYEYISLTCPHCASFHNNMLPEIKEKLLDTGKAKLIPRDFPLDNVAFAGSIIARCAGDDFYLNIIDWLFKNQQAWLSQSDPIAYLKQGALFFGINDAKFNACMADKSIQDNIFATYQEAQQKYSVTGTPSFVINGEKVVIRDVQHFIDIVEEAQ